MTSTLTAPIDGLLATPTARLPYQANVVVRSFVLAGDGGPTIVYNSPGISEAAHEIRELGTPRRLLVNHAHEGMYGPPNLDVPVWVHERDERETARSLPIAGTFAERSVLGGDLEVIPTPGHTAGTTSYLWDAGIHRFLFTGDFLWIEHGEWKAVVLDPSLRRAYLDSLALVRELDFDVLVPWGVTDDSAPIAVVGPGEARRRIDAIIARVEAGGSR
ncbi:MBL fold metallo-hydrolase [Pseudolysinimonas sp.]|jgi:glyoxylase-like metal-dependent hydrolase (beta-lactamase superfamily II)|uniref:MBL fold metallo-hydrolase n=1 Tax=Pseudolysinimonas sp. TaxID=2680009 RepID=UPI0037839FA7